MASSKLEMSLDDIIKQSKKTERSQKKVGGSVRKNQPKKTSIGLARKNKRIGRQRPNAVGKNKQVKNNKPIANQQRRKNVIGSLVNKRRNGVAIKNKPLTTAATMNLVKKLVKKALTQTNTLRPVRIRGIRGKFNRSRNVNPRILGRSPLNRVNNRSRIIGNRQRVIAPIQMPIARGRGARIMVPVMETIPAVRRIRYIPQRVANNRFGGAMGQVVRNNRGPKRVSQQQGFSTIRDQINALRQGAVRTQNRQQFVMVQQQPQVRAVQMQQFRRRQQPQQKQQHQFVRQRKQFQQVGTFYEPPNYLQRIPTQQQANYNGNRRFMGNF